MSLRITMSDAIPQGAGVWNVLLRPADVRRLGDSRSSLGGRSIVAAGGIQFDEMRRELSMSAEAVAVLNIGTAHEALVVDMGQAARTPQAISAEALSEVLFGKGDAAFLTACRRLMKPELADVGQQLIKTFRQECLGEMREGKARKWVNHPDNCLAITIQHRDQSYAIHIKGQPNDFDAPTLEIKPDRPSYCRFKLSAKEQLAEAMQVVLQSCRRYKAA